VVLYLFWRRKPESVLDLWLSVVIVLSLLAALQSSLFNAGRFDFGFYSGRLFGLAAASFVLINLLIENGRLYAKLAAGQAELRRLTTVRSAHRHRQPTCVRYSPRCRVAPRHTQPGWPLIVVARRGLFQKFQ
jgi:hypothetical protein